MIKLKYLSKLKDKDKIVVKGVTIMRRKVSLIMMFVFLFNFIPTSISSEMLGIMKVAQAQTVGRNITAQEAKKFTDRMSFGENHWVIINEDGTVSAFGSNASGQGNVSEWRDIVKVSSGYHHTVGLKKDGTVVTTEENSEVSSWTDIVDIAAGSDNTMGVKSDGTVVAVGGNSYGKNEVQDWRNIKKVALAENHTVGLKSDGTVVAIGYDMHGQTVVTHWKEVVDIGATSGCTYALTKDGKVTMAGRPASSSPAQWSDIVSISIKDANVLGLKSDGTVSFSGYYKYDYCGNNTCKYQVKDWNNIIGVAAGRVSLMGMKSNGEIIKVNNTHSSSCTSYKPQREIIDIESRAYRLNENVNIKLNKSMFYNMSGSDIYINDKLYKLNENSDYYEIDYITEASGDISIKVPELKDIYGNSFPVSYKEISSFLVYPLLSVTSNKQKVSNGERVTITANFSKRVQDDFTVELSGAINEKNLRMSEVQGSNGTKYMMSYVIPSVIDSGEVNFTINNLTEEGNATYYKYPYTEKNVFYKNIPSAPVEDIRVSKETYKIGDYINIGILFNKPVDSENILMDISGAIEAKNVRPGKGDPYGATYTHYINEGNVDGPIDITIKNVKGIDGTSYSGYNKENVATIYTKRPQVTNFTSSHKLAKLGDTVRFIATFNKQVKEDFLLSLDGQINMNNLSMIEVEGSNGIQYYYDHTVTENDLGKITDVTISEIKDLHGNEGYSDTFSEMELCTMDGKKPNIINTEVDSKIYKNGDVVGLIVSADEEIKPGIKATLLDGDKVLQEIRLEKIAGSNGKEFEAYFVIEQEYSCNVDLLIENIEDLAGIVSEYKKEDIFKFSANEKPVINGVEDMFLEYGEEFDPMLNVTATDFEDGNITDNIIVIGKVDVNKAGEYKLVYRVVDNDANITEVVRIVTINYEKEDINKDGEVNTLDLSLLGLNYNKVCHDVDWNANMDLNNDGIIDVFDLVLVSKKINYI